MNTSAYVHAESTQEFLFRNALERIRDLEAEIQKLRQGVSKSHPMIRIYQANRIITTSPNDILYIRAENNYSRVYLKNGQQYYVSRTLKSWADDLPCDDFVRCHRTFLVRREEVMEINRRTKDLVLRDGIKIPTSRRFQKSCLSTLFSQLQKPAATTIKLNSIVHKLTNVPSSPRG